MHCILTAFSLERRVVDVQRGQEEELDEEEREIEPGVGGEAASHISCRLELFCATSPSIFFKIFGCVCSKYIILAKSVFRRI